MSETAVLTERPFARRDAAVARWGMPILALCLLAITLPKMLIPGAPGMPWPVFAIVGILAWRVGVAVFRNACGMNPLAWLCFRLAGDDPQEALEQHRRRKRLDGPR